MKRILMIGMAVMLAMPFTACGKKTAPAESAASAATENAEIASSEAVGESVLTATVQKLAGDTLSVELDDGQSMSFNISGAAVSKAWELMPGDQVDIGYDGEDPVDGMAVKSVVVSVPFEYVTEGYTENSTLYGRIEAVDEKSITVRELLDERKESSPETKNPASMTEEDLLGESYTFARAPYETTVTKDGVKPGAYAQISYLGELTKDPVCFRICTEDMEEDPAAEHTGIRGQVEKVEDGVIYLRASEDAEFRFTTAGNEELLKQADALKGREVVLNFSDSLRQRVATADSIEEIKA